MNEMQIEINHVAASVSSLDESIAWYGRVLDLDLEQRFQIPGHPVEVAVLCRDGLRVELFEAVGSEPIPASQRDPDLSFFTQGYRHIALSVPDVHAAADALRARGADIVWVRDFDFGSRAFIRDNSGNLIEFVGK